MNPLTKSSGNDELKQYFNAILRLSKQDEAFPVDIDDVWGLVYSERGKAVTTLKKNFIEGEDYISFAQTVKREKGASVRTAYRLSLPCLEYFIARKIRSVFEVYRQVFHKVAEKKVEPTLPSTPMEVLLESVKHLVDIEKRQSVLESKIEQMEKRREAAELELFDTPLSENSVPEITLRTQINELVRNYADTYLERDYQLAWRKVYDELRLRYGVIFREDKQRNIRKIDEVERRGYLGKMYDVISNLIKIKK